MVVCVSLDKLKCRAKNIKGALEEKNGWKGYSIRYYNPVPIYSYYSEDNVVWCRDKQTDQLNRTGAPESDPHTQRLFIYDRGNIVDQ